MNRAEIAQPFEEGFHAQLVRVIGMLDRERFSPTSGCFDRTFWCWKFVDFPGARFQEGLCVLSYVWAHDHPGNPYFQNPKLLEWIGQGFEFWCRIQREQGDFDEAYPLERSLAATAFTTFYLCEAFGFLDGALPAETSERFVAGVERAGDWLCRNDETHGFLSNHLAAAAGALLHAHRITGHARFDERAGYFLNRILDHQSSEGWYDEYGGADVGYQTHGSFYLARCLELSPNDRLERSLSEAMRYLAHFVHPDGSIGGEYSSRNTQTYYPAAFEMLADRCGSARWIAETMRPSVRSMEAAGLGSVDPYNLFPLLNNYVFAHRAILRDRSDGPEPVAPFGPQGGRAHFPLAGLLVEDRPTYRAIIGLAKGGVLKLFERESGQLVASDCGYVGRLESGRVVSSQVDDRNRPIEVGKDSVHIEGLFAQVSRPVMSPIPFLGFRLFTLTLGRFPAIAKWVKGFLVKLLIYRKRDLDLRFERTIRFLDDAVVLEDRLEGEAPVAELEQGEFFTTIHMGSSRYFVPHEIRLANASLDPVLPGTLRQGVVRKRTIRVG
jgi:hypothetical protein